MKRATLTGSLTYEIVDNYIPEMLIFKKTTGALPTALRVTVSGTQVIVDLDANGMKAIAANRNINDPTSTYIKIPLADGLITGKNIQISITCAATSDNNDLIFFSRNKNGENLICSIRQKVFQSSSTRLKSFGLLYVDGSTVADSFNVTMNDGLVHPWTLDEVLLETYETTNGANTFAIFDNFDLKYKEVELILAADRYVTLVYFQSI